MFLFFVIKIKDTIFLSDFEEIIQLEKSSNVLQVSKEEDS